MAVMLSHCGNPEGIHKVQNDQVLQGMQGKRIYGRSHHIRRDWESCEAPKIGPRETKQSSL